MATYSGPAQLRPDAACCSVALVESSWTDVVGTERRRDAVRARRHRPQLAPVKARRDRRPGRPPVGPVGRVDVELVRRQVGPGVVEDVPVPAADATEMMTAISTPRLIAASAEPDRAR